MSLIDLFFCGFAWFALQNIGILKVESLTEIMMSLWKMELSLIISYPGKEEGLFKDLYMHKCFGTVMTIKNQSKAIGIALRAIRNNLFHGGKLYESSADKNLLKLATPILKIILLKAANEIMHIDLNRSNKDESDKV